MKKYLLVFAISIQDIFEYRFNFMVHTFKYAFMVILTAMVWLAVLKENPNMGYNMNETIVYFVYAAILYSFSSFHTWYLENDIKLGTLSKYLLKPLSTFKYYFSYQIANATIETIIKILAFIPILYFLHLLPTISLKNLGFFLIFLPLIFFFSFTMFFLISSLTFWLTEVWSIRWALTIFFRFLSGMMIPLSFFPTIFQKISFYLPFQHLVFTPIRIMQNALSTTHIIQSFCILLLWSIVLTIVRKIVWQRGVHSYDGTGI